MKKNTVYVDKVDPKLCMKCESSCQECSNGTRFDCSKCKTGDYLFENGSCGSCPFEGYYKDENT